MLDHEQIIGMGLHFPDITADDRLIEELAASASAARLGRGKSICHQGDNCTHLALVTAGCARVFKLAESGREITLYRVEPGECCILTASCMLSGRAFPADATAESDLDAVLVPQSRVLKWMTSSESWRHYLWDLLAGRLGDVISLIEEVAFRRMDERLGNYLASHARENGSVLLATHQQIAADLGTSREVVSRMLKDFQSRGLLNISRGRIDLGDPGPLESIARICD